MIGIIDYQVGNLASIQNAIDYLGFKSQIQKDPQKILQYDHLILPGVGAFGDAMGFLKSTGMQEAILEYVKSGRLLLGICLGMQLLFEKSHEFGVFSGLGLIKGEILPFSKDKLTKDEKIPHMGYNTVEILQKSPLLEGLENHFYLYFVHSFYAPFCHQKYAITKSTYGVEFISILQQDNIFAIQPHPEKSHKMGLKLLKNFMTLC